MRYLAMIPLLMLVACGSQGRDVDERDPWEDYDPEDVHRTYDEDYVPPAQMDADQLVARARKAERDGRDDRARVEYHAAFLKDRWHADGNTGYQDLMIRNDLWDVLWQEYLDLWQANPTRGDALYFHLRPMLLKRKSVPVPVERRETLTQQQIERINELTALSADHAESGDRDAAVRAIDQAIEIADFPILHRVRIELLYPTSYDALLEEYSERAEENPASGDNLYLHAKVVSYRDPQAALELMRDGWILGIPGWWLRFGLAEICLDLAESKLSDAIAGDKDARRWVLGYYGAAESFYLACLDARPNDRDCVTALGYLRTQRDRLK